MTDNLLLEKNPYKNANEIEVALKKLMLEDSHLLPYTKALFDAEVSRAAKNAWDSVYKRDSDALARITFPEFTEIKSKAESNLNQYSTDGTWSERVKGRDLLKAYCGELGIKYEHFRNLIIAAINKPPSGIADIINKIKTGGNGCTTNVST